MKTIIQDGKLTQVEDGVDSEQLRGLPKIQKIITALNSIDGDMNSVIKVAQFTSTAVKVIPTTPEHASLMEQLNNLKSSAAKIKKLAKNMQKSLAGKAKAETDKLLAGVPSFGSLSKEQMNGNAVNIKSIIQGMKGAEKTMRGLGGSVTTMTNGGKKATFKFGSPELAIAAVKKLKKLGWAFKTLNATGNNVKWVR